MKTWEELTKHSATLQGVINELLQRHGALQSFSDAQEWDKDAQAIIDLLQGFQVDLDTYREEQISVQARLEQEHNQKSFFNKVFSSRVNENDVKEQIQKAESGIKSIGNGIEVLQEMMDKIPANKQEQKELADELRQLKKELVVDKREINENLRQTRANARTKNANLAGINSGILRNAARYERTSIRLAKERALVPLEGQKAFIEKKLLAIEKDLNWVLHFKGDNLGDAVQPAIGADSEKVQRCAYCGRRVTTDVCQGCGAVV